MGLPDLNRVTRWAPAAFLAVSAALLLTVYMFQHLGGLEPCHLCVIQRYPHFIVLGFALIAIVFGRKRRAITALLLVGIAAAYLAGAGYAAFHVGVEGGHFQSACAGQGPAGSIEDLKARILAAPTARCDDVAWSLFGVSMAGWNGILSVVMALAALYAAWRNRPQAGARAYVRT
ncbi:MAG: disulfide bond formation protein B [Alphaproteobacteria bacterium]|nr:disulfide bond formation protein B [Alphaproteobacteria bacterium]